VTESLQKKYLQRLDYNIHTKNETKKVREFFLKKNDVILKNLKKFILNKPPIYEYGKVYS